MTQDHPSRGQVHVVDARGLNCPLPVLRLRKRLEDLVDGAAVDLLATDRATLRDVPAYCQAHGHVLAGVVEDDQGGLRFSVVKASPPMPEN